MNTEERARELAREIASFKAVIPSLFLTSAQDIIAAAIREERERCAEIADGFTCGGCGMDGKAAAAIRSQP